jgi:hypothetical protein
MNGREQIAGQGYFLDYQVKAFGSISLEGGAASRYLLENEAAE